MALKQYRGGLLRLGKPGLQTYVPATTAFDPATYGTVAAWYDARKETPVADGTAILPQDWSGNTRHMTQATGTKKPLYKTAVQNSLPTFLYDGVDDFTAATFTLNQPCTLVVAGKWVAETAGNANMLSGDAGDISLYKAAGSPGAVSLWGGSGALALSAGGATTFSVYVGIYNGATSSIRRDQGTATSGSGGTANPGGLKIGSNLNGNNNFSNVHIGCVIVYSGALSGANLTGVQAALKTIWGTP